MASLVPGLGKSRPIAVALLLGIWSLGGPGALAGDDNPAVAGTKAPRRKKSVGGTLGYGAPGAYPGFQGFGLGYHPGYGYGGAALGVGAEGGYPFYGGPGYPHPAPCLRRLAGIVPFGYFGGPGGPLPDQPHFFGMVGPLATDKPVVTIEGGPAEEDGYGCFTGMIPYPESTFAPFTTEGTGSNPARPADASGVLGLDTASVVDAGLAKGIKVTRITPGGEADKAGLKVGDEIRAVNGYLTEQPGNLTWIIANASPDNTLRMTVLTAKEGEIRTITARRP